MTNESKTSRRTFLTRGGLGVTAAALWTQLGEARQLFAEELADAQAAAAVTDGALPTPPDLYSIDEVQCYDTKGGDWLVHADLYRIEDEAELSELGLDDVFDAAICLIEWPDRLGKFTPERRIDLRLTTDGETRIAEIVPAGEWGDRLDNV